MHRNLCLVAAAFAAGSLLPLTACDDDGDDSSSSSSSSSSGTTSTSTSGTGGQGGGTGGSATGGGGEGGGGLSCPSCTDLIQNGALFTQSCGYDVTYAQCNPGSSCELWDTLTSCMCNPSGCMDPNVSSCYGNMCQGHRPTPDCITCVEQQCGDEWDACNADTDGMEGTSR